MKIELFCEKCLEQFPTDSKQSIYKREKSHFVVHLFPIFLTDNAALRNLYDYETLKPYL